MIGLTIAGCGIGAALFWLVLQFRPPKPDALVMLARFDAAQEAPDTPGRDRFDAQVRRRRGDPDRPAGRGRAGAARDHVDLASPGPRAQRAIVRRDDGPQGRGRCPRLHPWADHLGRADFPRAAAACRCAAGHRDAVRRRVLLHPDVDARSAATRRRREFKRALGAYLDWVSLQMSGKAAAEQALPDAAKIGSGWPLALIRHTVTNATRSGQDVWVALTDLGERIGVAQLRELGTLVQLVANDGAQVRDTLAARAASLRNEELADAEGNAGKRDQSMLMAQILLGAGFAVFLGYPAVVNFMHI